MLLLTYINEKYSIKTHWAYVDYLAFPYSNVHVVVPNNKLITNK